jgi:hypothetical protein
VPAKAVVAVCLLWGGQFWRQPLFSRLLILRGASFSLQRRLQPACGRCTAFMILIRWSTFHQSRSERLLFTLRRTNLFSVLCCVPDRLTSRVQYIVLLVIIRHFLFDEHRTAPSNNVSRFAPSSKPVSSRALSLPLPARRPLPQKRRNPLLRILRHRVLRHHFFRIFIRARLM